MKATVQTPARVRKGRHIQFKQMELPGLGQLALPGVEFERWRDVFEGDVEHQAVELVVEGDVEHQAVELVVEGDVEHQAVELVDARRVCHSAMTNTRVRPLRASARRLA